MKQSKDDSSDSENHKDSNKNSDSDSDEKPVDISKTLPPKDKINDENYIHDHDQVGKSIEVVDPRTQQFVRLTKTVYGNIELDFNRTKIIKNGKLFDMDEVDNPDNEGTTIEQVTRAKKEIEETQVMREFEKKCNQEFMADTA